MKIKDRQKKQREIEKACSKMGKVVGSCMPDGVGFALIFTEFRKLRDSIYKTQGFGWDANPMVWCCEFEVIGL